MAEQTSNVQHVDFKNKRKINLSVGTDIIPQDNDGHYHVLLIEGQLRFGSQQALTAKQAAHHTSLLLRGLHSKYIEQYPDLIVTGRKDETGAYVHYMLSHNHHYMSEVLAKIVTTPQETFQNE